MMNDPIDRTRFPSIERNLLAAPGNWAENDVPVARRGVRVSWLLEMIRDLIADINRPREDAISEVSRAESHNRAGMWGMHDQPDIPIPPVPPYALLNVHAFVKHFVLPLTRDIQAPLWAFVPEEHRGVPDHFVSHTWNSLLLGPQDQAIGTLDAIGKLKEFVWIDFVSYNQHMIESIPADMETVIGEIGKVAFAGTPVPTLGRIWCLWELLCANRTGTDFDIAIRPGYRNDKILAVNTFYRSFIGVEKAMASHQQDLDIIFQEVLAQFSSINAANEHFEKVLRERLSGPWYELRERDQHLGFRPWPLTFEHMEGGEELAKRPVVEADPYYGAGVRNSVVYNTRQSTFDSLIGAGIKVGSDDMEAHELRTSTESDLKFIQAASSGDVDMIKHLLPLVTHIDKSVYFGSALSHAAEMGHTHIIEFLLESGADIDGANGLSPLACAAKRGLEDTVLLLLAKGADLEADAGGPGTALFQACSYGEFRMVCLLVELGANVNTKTEKRATPLLIAASSQHTDIVTHLIHAGADLDCTDRSGDTALHHAAHKGAASIVSALVEAGADRTITDKYGETAYDLGLRVGRLGANILKQLMP